ncbi:MAG: NAD(P)H-hydrate dehydratase [Desulfurococcaceae archaeon]
MGRHMLGLLSPDEMKLIDDEAPKYGVHHGLLMEAAGHSVYLVVQRELGSLEGKRIAVIAGTGNNGGDAMVAARYLSTAGALVKVYVIGRPEEMSPLAREQYERLLAFGVEVSAIDAPEKLQQLKAELPSFDAAVVGLIGIGLRGEVTGLRREAIEIINSANRPVISVDIPSGVDASNGQVMGVAVKSRATVTFGLPKLGNILYPGHYYCGRLYLSRLCYPPRLLQRTRTFLNEPVPLPERLRWGHKGTFGKLLVVGGSRYYYGAPYYSASSFLRAGGGYARLAAPKSVVPFIASRNSEIVFVPLEETPQGAASVKNLEDLLELVKRYDVDFVIVGPGLSLDEEAQELARSLIRRLEVPVLVDGDGLTALAKSPEILLARRAPTVLTPHPGEFSRLVGREPQEVSKSPVEAAREFASRYNVYLVLKGARTIVAEPDLTVHINVTGNPGLAKAGSGDVLCGVIAAMYGLGLRDVGRAARMGVLVHGLAADLAAADVGEDGVTPDILLDYLPHAIKLMRERPLETFRRYMPLEL